MGQDFVAVLIGLMLVDILIRMVVIVALRAAWHSSRRSPF